VRLRISGGKITAADAVGVPDGGVITQRINPRVPVLARECLPRRPDNIDLVQRLHLRAQRRLRDFAAVRAIDKAHL